MSGLSTVQDHGIGIWCNACDDFPDSFQIRSTDDSVIIKCRDCGEMEEYDD